jgi:putative hydrolase of the HAD superfamily
MQKSLVVVESATQAPRALIFDIGRVIVRVDISRALTALGAGAHLSAEQVWSAIQSDPRMRDFQEGRLSSHQWHEHLARRFGLKLSFEQFCAIWNSALDSTTLLGQDLFAELAGRHRLLLLSNTDPIHVAHLETNFRFPRHFHARIYSCVAGVSKPDPAIYRQAIRAAGASPDEILYIDDAGEYVEAGQRAGLETIQFRGAEQLLSEFRRRGILRP